MKNLLRYLIILVFSLSGVSGLAVVKIPSSKGEEMLLAIHVTGTVEDNGSCKFSPGSDQTIDFGDYIFHPKQDGSYYINEKPEKGINGYMLCTGSVEEIKMRLSNSAGEVMNYNGFKYLPVKYDTDGSNSKSLGIALLVDGSPQNIDEWFDIDYQHQPLIQVMLKQVGDGKDFVDNANFSANATLTVEFN